MTARSKIQKLIIEHPGTLEALDGLVHDNASQLATTVNNEGLKAQLAFLAEERGVTAEEVLQFLEEAIAP